LIILAVLSEKVARSLCQVSDHSSCDMSARNGLQEIIGHPSVSCELYISEFGQTFVCLTTTVMWIVSMFICWTDSG